MPGVLEAGGVSAAVREAIRHLDGRWVRLWLRSGSGPVAGIVRLRTDDAGFLLERPGGAVQPAGVRGRGLLERAGAGPGWGALGR
jgi:hypothetical protein